MRKMLLVLLLATTAATPALAQRTDREEREAAREERKAERSERAAARSEAPAPRVDRSEAREGRAEARQERAEQRSTNVNERGRPTLDERRATRDAAVEQRAATREDRQQARQDRADSRAQWQQQANQARVRPPVGARPDRPAPPPAQEVASAAPKWHNTWRSDNRYDWRRWRDRNHSLFRLGFYFDPFGWNYHRWGIGWRLWPSYYDRSYWLNDPWMYRLPYAPWPYQWVRYWDDALLVNTISGRVVDVEYNFFW